MPTLARVLLAPMAASFAAVLAGDLVGRAPPLLPEAWWDKAYNATETVAVGACVVRTVRATGPERRAWLAFTIGLFAFFAGYIYYAVALSGLAAPPFPSPANPGYLGIYPAVYLGLVLLLRARRPDLARAVAGRSRLGARRRVQELNDAFGHPAGDALLERLGANLAQAVPDGAAYRMGGDELCVLARVAGDDAEALVANAFGALSERGERFRVGCSDGTVLLAGGALRAAVARDEAERDGARVTAAGAAAPA